jgi:hypothetical protein
MYVEGFSLMKKIKLLESTATGREDIGQANVYLFSAGTNKYVLTRTFFGAQSFCRLRKQTEPPDSPP